MVEMNAGKYKKHWGEHYIMNNLKEANCGLLLTMTMLSCLIFISVSVLESNKSQHNNSSNMTILHCNFVQVFPRDKKKKHRWHDNY